MTLGNLAAAGALRCRSVGAADRQGWRALAPIGWQTTRAKSIFETVHSVALIDPQRL